MRASIPAHRPIRLPFVAASSPSLTRSPCALDTAPAPRFPPVEVPKARDQHLLPRATARRLHAEVRDEVELGMESFEQDGRWVTLAEGQDAFRRALPADRRHVRAHRKDRR